MFRLTIMDEYTRRILEEFTQMDRGDYLHMIRNFDTDEALETLYECWDYLVDEADDLNDLVEYMELRDLTWEEINKWCDFEVQDVLEPFDIEWDE